MEETVGGNYTDQNAKRPEREEIANDTVFGLMIWKDDYDSWATCLGHNYYFYLHWMQNECEAEKREGIF